MTKTKNNLDLCNDLVAVGEGDRDAMHRLYEATGGKLYSICFKVLRNRPAAEDVLQEVYIKIWNRAAGFDPDKGSAMAWLGLIARNSAIDRVRARARRKTTGDDALWTIADDSEQADDRIMRESEEAMLSAHVDHLQEPDQTYIREAYFTGMTYSQVAEKTGVPLGTVKTRIRRGLAALRQRVHRD